MKFYKNKYNFNYNYLFITVNNKLTAIHSDYYAVRFYKNGKEHNSKNASYSKFRYKEFCLNGKKYGYDYTFTKKSWRKFVRELKLQAFL